MGGSGLFQRSFSKILLFVLLSFRAYDSQPYKVITRALIYKIYISFMQNMMGDHVAIRLVDWGKRKQTHLQTHGMDAA